jgi:hypothetical protein
MHFNTKYIFNGDPEKEIIRKINYNFDQILSFAIGPDGHVGPIGPVGIFGAAGMKGMKGSRGNRGTNWYNQPTQPTSGVFPYDLWIDNSTGAGDIKFLDPATSLWTDTGHMLFNSAYFRSFQWMAGPGGATDRKVIGIKSSPIDPNKTTLVISDGVLGSGSINPNNSKLVVSTSDALSYPIFSFAKSGNVNSGIPSFYWTGNGNSASLGFRSSGDLNINTYNKFTIDSYPSRMTLNSDYATLNNKNFLLFGTGDFYFTSNTTVGIGSPFILNSQNLVINNTDFRYYNSLRLSSSIPGAYVLNSTPSSSNLNGGINIEIDQGATSAFSFGDLTGSSVFSAKPIGPYGSGNVGQTIFGSTGGSTGGTGGPYLYQVSNVNIIKTAAVSALGYNYSSPTSTSVTLRNVVDLSSVNLWRSDSIVVTPDPIDLGSQNHIYIKIPSSTLTDNLPLYSSITTNKYKVFLNSTDVAMNLRYFGGVVFTIGSTTYYKDFPSNGNFGGNCRYVEFTFLGFSNTTRLKPRLFYKTCNGTSGFIDFELATAVVNQPSQVLVNWSYTHINRNRDAAGNYHDTISQSGVSTMRIYRNTSTLVVSRGNSGSATLFVFNAGDDLRLDTTAFYGTGGNQVSTTFIQVYTNDDPDFDLITQEYFVHTTTGSDSSNTITLEAGKTYNIVVVDTREYLGYGGQYSTANTFGGG